MMGIFGLQRRKMGCGKLPNAYPMGSIQAMGKTNPIFLLMGAGSTIKVGDTQTGCLKEGHIIKVQQVNIQEFLSDLTP